MPSLSQCSVLVQRAVECRPPRRDRALGDETDVCAAGVEEQGAGGSGRRHGNDNQDSHGAARKVLPFQWFGL